MRQVATPLLSETSPLLESLAVREVASYFPGLSNCESDVIKFLTKKIKAFIKQHKYRANLKKKESEKDKNPNPVNEEQNEPPVDPNPVNEEQNEPPVDPNPVNEEQNEPPVDPFDFESELDRESTVTGSVSHDLHHTQETQPSVKKTGKFAPRKKPAPRKQPEKTILSACEQPVRPTQSPRKRSLLENKSEGHIIKANSPPKAKKSKTPDPVSSVDGSNDPVNPREFCSNNPENVKFQEGDFVVLGEDVDTYHFCKIDKIDYDKQSTKYFMNVTYHELIDGRLEECLKPKTTKIWHAKRVPLNTVILNLRYTRLVDNDIKSRISAITKELYS